MGGGAPEEKADQQVARQTEQAAPEHQVTLIREDQRVQLEEREYEEIAQLLDEQVVLEELGGARQTRDLPIVLHFVGEIQTDKDARDEPGGARHQAGSDGQRRRAQRRVRFPRKQHHGEGRERGRRRPQTPSQVPRRHAPSLANV